MTQSTNTDDSGTKMEHERRFYPRLDMLPLDYITFPKKLIEQGYLEDELRTRLRNERNESSVNTYLQTRKSGSGVSRCEDEIEISKDIFDIGWQKRTCDLQKTRYYYPLENGTAEINIFHVVSQTGTLDTYIQIEVEFGSHDEAVAFIPPEWLGEEVTDDPRHGNYALAKDGFNGLTFSQI